METGNSMGKKYLKRDFYDEIVVKRCVGVEWVMGALIVLGVQRNCFFSLLPLFCIGTGANSWLINDWMIMHVFSEDNECICMEIKVHLAQSIAKSINANWILHHLTAVIISISTQLVICSRNYSICLCVEIMNLCFNHRPVPLFYCRCAVRYLQKIIHLNIRWIFNELSELARDNFFHLEYLLFPKYVSLCG